VVVAASGEIYTTTNSGSYMERTECAQRYSGLALPLLLTEPNWLLGVSGDAIYQSLDAGISWSATASPFDYWNGIGSSADGSKIVAATAEQIVTLTNGGVATLVSRHCTALVFCGQFRRWQQACRARSDDGSGDFVGGPILTSTNSGKHVGFQ